ncbi:MAG TPA: metallophosphoesterase [Chitinophagaceae bacterium]|nr:metallophosphoesterase [Chitinophagaceae bacterium]
MQRRKFLQNVGAATVAASVPLVSKASAEKPKLIFTVAHLTDIHVKPDSIAEEGMRKAFRHANSLTHAPLFIINGGDSIMDAMAADKDKTKEQWDVWNRIITKENKLPVYHCIGNHDAWGWELKDESIKSDPLYDKGWVIKQHKMPNRFYSFEQPGWKFIVLDSAHENNGGYIAKIDDEQFLWLEDELRRTASTKHICIVSHIPIVSFCAAMFFDKNQDNGDWRLPRNLLHTDTRKLKSLFKNYKNIRCCISGHIHLQDEVEYLGIKYFCNGAVSGRWWKGPFQDFAPAYALMKFYKDGSVEREIVEYG